jgi:DNA-binding CsgD family transcriptional regulator
MQIKQLAEAVLHQMPGVFLIKEVKDRSYYHTLNLTFAKMIGYNSVADAIGLTDEDAKSDEIVEGAATFYRHDKLVMTGQTIRTLDVYPYKINDFVGILAIKKPLLDDEGNVCAVLAQGFPLKKCDIDRMIKNLPGLHSFPKKVNRNITKTYEIRDNRDFGLTKKEFESLFYLLRGKSIAETSTILNRSARTVETHIENIKNKLGLCKKSELFDFAYAHGLINIIPHTLVSGTMSLDV